MLVADMIFIISCKRNICFYLTILQIYWRESNSLPNLQLIECHTSYSYFYNTTTKLANVEIDVSFR